MKDRRGFTLLELIVVIAVGAILLSITVNAFGNIRARYAVREAENTFRSLHARTRSQAIEFGQNIELHWDNGGDSVWVERNDTVFDIIRLQNQFGVDMRGTGSHVLCMNPRGFAASSCTSFTSTATIAFTNGSDSTTLRMSTLGMLTN